MILIANSARGVFGISGIAEAARWDDAGNSLRVGGYGTADARVSWRFADAWTLQANLVNAFDRNYETSAYYLQPGREVRVESSLATEVAPSFTEDSSQGSESPAWMPGFFVTSIRALEPRLHPSLRTRPSGNTRISSPIGAHGHHGT